MLFLLADFIDILINRVLRFIKRKDKGDGYQSNRSNGNLNNLNAERFDIVLETPITTVKDKLKDYAALNPTPPGSPCTCIVADKGDGNKILYQTEKKVSTDACKALDRRFGNEYYIHYVA